MHYVYIISETGPDGYSKIGVSANPANRLRELSTGNPRPLTIVKTWAFEHRSKAFEFERKILCEANILKTHNEWVELEGEYAVDMVDNMILREYEMALDDAIQEFENAT